ncbi:GNAT family N-acetyltransferase [Microbacterium lacticum]|uniref:GNAT family N-acetyltransferase n=1 Tax=Microbacterium lacticum TaxID=33885 RepID=UPI00325B5203
MLNEVSDEIHAPDGEAEPSEVVRPVAGAASGVEDRAIDGLRPAFDEVPVAVVNGIHCSDHLRIRGRPGRVCGGHIEHFLRLPARKTRVVDTVGHVQDAAEWTLRPREDRDLERIVGWIPDAEALRLFSGTRLSWPLTVRQLQEVTEASALAPYVVAAASGELVGHFDLRLEEWVVWLGRVVVDPSQRGQGLARGVVKLAVVEAHRLGAHRVRLNVISSNVPAVRAYRRAGFLAQPSDDAQTEVTVMERTLAEEGFGSRVLVTGMSGSGKSTVLRCLSGRGYRTLDTDYDEWVLGDGRWDESRMAELLASEKRIAVSGTVENQGSFYDRFEHVVLLSAPVEVLLERLHSRTDNPYGRSQRDREEVRRYVAEVEPLLRAGADVELDARRPVDELADEIELLLTERRRRIPRGP